MASIFCTSCGAKHEYNGFAPNFCSKCGTQIGSATIKKQPIKKVVDNLNDSEEPESEDTTNIDEIPDIAKLDVEIEIEGGFRAFSLEELSKQPRTAKTKKFIPKRHSGIGDLSPIKYGSSNNEEKD